MNEVHMTRTDPQLHQLSFISDIAQKISDIEIFQRKIESYTGFKKHEIDPLVHLPINSVESLDSLEKVLQYKAIQDVVVSTILNFVLEISRKEDLPNAAKISQSGSFYNC